MEASKFHFGPMPPAFKFDPTDADIVAYYLLPRALNLPNPYAGAIIEADPASAPPWEILDRCGNVDHAFFFSPPTDPSRNGGRRSRTVRGGVWQGQSGTEKTVTLLRPGGGKVNIRYKRYDLSFCLSKKGGGTTGYVMHEYEIVSPPLPGTVLTRIKVPRKAANRQSVPVAPAAAIQQVADPEQPFPSYEYDGALGMSNGDGFGGTQDGALYGGGMIENDGYYGYPLQYELPKVEYDDNNCTPLQYELPKVEYDDNNCTPLQYELPKVEYDDNNCVSIPDQPGAGYNSYNYDGAMMNCEGFTTTLQYELPKVEYDDNNGVSIPDQPAAGYNNDAAMMNSEGFTTPLPILSEKGSVRRCMSPFRTQGRV